MDEDKWKPKLNLKCIQYEITHKHISPSLAQYLVWNPIFRTFVVLFVWKPNVPNVYFFRGFFSFFSLVFLKIIFFSWNGMDYDETSWSLPHTESVSDKKCILCLEILSDRRRRGTCTRLDARWHVNTLEIKFNSTKIVRANEENVTTTLRKTCITFLHSFLVYGRHYLNSS